jgi:hypothetical protein
MQRREFLKTSAAVASAAMLPWRETLAQQTRPTTRPMDFEVSASLYAWELHDEGVENVLDNLQKMAAVNSVYLVAVMHPEKRPLTSDAFPHNPVRKTWMAEDSRAYWHPDLSRYGRIKPKLSDFDWLNQTDWVKTLNTAARKRGIKTGAEISHTVVDKIRAEGELADVMQRDIRGNIAQQQLSTTSPQRYLHPVCHNNSDGREYILNLFRDLAANYDLDYIQWCTIPFDQGGADKGACFCDSCIKQAATENFDLAAARAVLLKDPMAQPQLDQWRKFRCTSLARMYANINTAVHQINPKIDLRFNIYFRNPMDWGVDLKMIRPHLNSLRVMEYTEQQGNPAAMVQKTRWLNDMRNQIGPDFPILSAIAVRPKATPELIRQGVQIAVDCGVSGITLGHYDGAEFPMLRAIRQGLVNAKIPVSS